MAALEVYGYWWLPEREDHKVPGILSFDTETGGHLQLVGAFYEFQDLATKEIVNGETRLRLTDADLEKVAEIPRILGEAGPRGFTLERCIEVNRQDGLLAKASGQKILVHWIYESVHFEPDEEARGDGFYIAYKWANHWVGQSGIKFDPADNNAGKLSNMTAQILPTLSTTSRSGIQLSLIHQVRPEQTSDRGSFSESHVFRAICSEVQPVEELLAIASDLQDLISISTDRIAAFDSVAIVNPDLIQKAEDGSENRILIPVMAEWTVKSVDEKHIEPGEAFFDLNLMGGIHLLGQWLETASQYRSTLDRVMATRYSSSMFPTDRYANRIAALEGFDKVDHPSPANLRARLTRCVDYAGSPAIDLVPDKDKWIDTLIEERNELAHHGKQVFRRRSAHQYVLAESCYWLFVISILRKAGIAEAALTQLQKNRKYAWLRRRLAEVLS